MSTAEKRYTIDTTGLPRRGSPGFVRVEIVECGDLDCPFCKRATDTLDDEIWTELATFLAGLQPAPGPGGEAE